MSKEQQATKILNDIYLELLNRPIDPSGIKSYIQHIHKPNGIKQITRSIMQSPEFKNKHHNNFNSMAGDRKSYIDNDNYIAKSPYHNIFRKIIKQIILLDNQQYDTNSLEDRISTVEQSLSHIAINNKSFTIFPHRESHFNTINFNESLKDINNFKYWVYYLCISNLWKQVFNKVVATCGTSTTVNRILKLTDHNFESMFASLNNLIVDYLSIRIIGRLLNNHEKNIFNQYILDNNSFDGINYIESLESDKLSQESIVAESQILQLTKTLGRKPKLLVMIAYLETQNAYFIYRMMENVNLLQKNNPLLDISFALDNARISKEATDYTPWSRVKRIRNLMINKYPIHNYDYLYIIDSDIIDYPLNFPTRAIGLNPNGITAPMALIQNSTVFYDWCGYQKLGATSIYSEYNKFILDKGCKHRNFKLNPPYVDNPNRLVEIDCVGCTYVVPTNVFKQTYGNLQNELIEVFKLAKVTNHKIQENIVQYEDHPTFTDHYTVCAAVRANGGKIYMDRASAAYHADLPIHGEAWH